jgi:hypothetical protein
MYAARRRVPCERLVVIDELNFISVMSGPHVQETIASLKEKVHVSSDIAAARQRIIFKGAEVHNHVQMRAAGTLFYLCRTQSAKELSNWAIFKNSLVAGLTDGAVVHLVERLITPEPGTTFHSHSKPIIASIGYQ